MTMKPVDPEKMRIIEQLAREIGTSIGRVAENACGERMGFLLMFFSFDGAELTYISNADRADVVKMLQEFINANAPPLTWDEQHG